MTNIIFNKKKFVSLLVVVFIAATAHAQQGTAAISGEVLDMACYMKSGARGSDHKDCASACIKGGSPMGVLTSDNKVYLLVENHDKPAAYAEAKKHAGEQVTITGSVTERNGLTAIIADAVKSKM